MESQIMIVLRTLAQGVTAHAGARYTEYVGLFALAGLGFILNEYPNVLEQSPSFSVLIRWAAQDTWSILLLTIGLMRAFALLINGSYPWFPYSPLIRHVVSWIALIFWFLMWNGVYIALRDAGGLPTGVVMYALPIILEFRNMYVSRYDMVVARRRE